MILQVETEQDAAHSSAVLDRARHAGFDAVLYRGSRPLFGRDALDPEPLIRDAETAKLRPILAVDLARFPLDHELVTSHPQLFAIRRTGRHDGPIDPRQPIAPLGEALARLNHADANELLAKAIGDRLVSLAAAGVAGFQFLNPHRQGKRIFRAMRERLADFPVLTLAGPSAGRSEPDASIGELDRQIVSFGLTDLQSGVLPAETIERGNGVPVMGELTDEACGGKTDPATLLMGAAALCSGIIVPEAVLAARPDLLDVASRASDLVRGVTPYEGTSRILFRSGSVLAVARTRKGDDRASKGALLVLINFGLSEQPAPDAGALVQRTGTPLDLAGADLSSLAAGEVRIVAVEPSTPVMCEAMPGDGVSQAALEPRLVAEIVSPRVDGGDFPVKRVVGDRIEVSAAIFSDGHEELAAELRWRCRDQETWASVRMQASGKNDLWVGSFTPVRLGAHEFCIVAWLDRFGGFRRDFAKKRAAGVAQPVDHADGRALMEAAAARADGILADRLKAWLDRLDTATSADDSAATLLDEELAEVMAAVDDRPFRIVSRRQRLDAERLAARYSSWYELFPRSMTEDKSRHGTLADVIPHLARIRDMGFDTLYFPPIHPIGKTNRKGPNNTLTPAPHDVGSPYAIGSPDGGHDAIHPELGSFEDFDRLVDAARDHGLEIALDFAIQASPDHPWLTEHPGWFSWRPDGSMKYAENPPKKYQDIVNLDFYGPDAVPELWLALRDVVLLWIDHGVKTFRVDNPHTKPLPFWEWMIADVRRAHPEAIFLAEAFTRPTMMYRLAKVGFSQSYTYFTWRDGKQELIEYITELVTTEPREFYRPHFFVNTPDINPMFLQTSGRPGFQIRAVLAATLSGLFGVYSGFEFCESAPLPGREEYRDSEKYEIRPRDFAAPGNIIADITLLNRLRRAHPALQTHLNTRFYLAHNEAMIWYGKPSPDGGEMIMVMVNLDPHHAQETHFEVPLWEFDLPETASIQVEDLGLGYRFQWHGKTQWIRLTPDLPYRIWRLSAPGGTA